MKTAAPLTQVADLASPDLRCNVGGASGAQTSVIDVKPGETFSFTLDTAVYHQGPISLYVSTHGACLLQPRHIAGLKYFHRGR